jgi:hypothetical protein
VSTTTVDDQIKEFKHPNNIPDIMSSNVSYYLLVLSSASAFKTTCSQNTSIAICQLVNVDSHEACHHSPLHQTTTVFTSWYKTQSHKSHHPMNRQQPPLRNPFQATFLVNQAIHNQNGIPSFVSHMNLMRSQPPLLYTYLITSTAFFTLYWGKG